MEINGPLTPKVPLINDLHGAAKWLLPRSPEPSRRQKAQSKHQSRGSFMFSQQQEHLLSFSPVLLQSLLACLPTRWKLDQPSPQLIPETSPMGFWRGGRHQSSWILLGVIAVPMSTAQSGCLPSCKVSA